LLHGQGFKGCKYVLSKKAWLARDLMMMTPNVAESLIIKQTGRQRITVEKAIRNKDLFQCYKYQNFGHSIFIFHKACLWELCRRSSY